MDVKIYHNPQCSKSRQALELLQQHKIQPKIFEYLKTPPNKQELQHIVNLLQVPVAEIVRESEDVYNEIIANNDLSDDELLDAIVKYPKLLQRPIIVVDDKKAVVARPPSNVLKIISSF